MKYKSMKRWLPFALILTVSIAALIFSERRALRTVIGPRALMSWLGDTEREVTRIPARIARLSDSDEIALGDRLAQYYAEPLTDADAQMRDYIAEIGARLASHATRKLPYHFHYISDRSFENAFALPGGHVFIGAGLIARMKTEDELASVLGRELEHVDRYHCAERAQIEAASRNLGIIGAIASLPVELFVAGYSKQQELEADTEGVRLSVLAGYSPYGARDLMQRFAHLEDEAETSDPNRGTRRRRTVSTGAANTPAGEVLRVPVQTLSDYFRSHPPADERAAAIDALITREHWQSRRAQTPLRTHQSPDHEITR